MTVLVGAWLALGSGPMPQRSRVALTLEQAEHSRQRANHTVYSHTADEHRALVTSRKRLLAGEDEYYGRHRMRPLVEFGHARVHAAVHRASSCTEPLRGRLLAAAARVPQVDHDRRPTPAFTCSEASVAAIERLVDAQFAPQVQRYTSTLGPAGFAKFTGIIAAALLSGLMLLVAPLWGGTLIAQEVHDKTLQPLTGTALSARQLAVGMLAAPIVAVGVVAAPLVVLLLVTAAAAGSLIPALGALCLLAVGSLLAGLGAQIVGLSLGEKRTPGVVGIALLAVLGGALALGIGAASKCTEGTIGMVALLPHFGIGRLFTESFVPQHVLTLSEANRLDLSLVLAMAGFAFAAGLGVRVVTRWIGRTPTGLLTRAEALLGAATVSGLSMLALWEGPSRLAELTVLSTALIAVPLLALLMARVPGGETPPPLRVIPVVPLLRDLGLVAAAHVMLCLAVAQRGSVDDILGLATIHVIWGVMVAGLAAIRVAAAPCSLGARLLLAVALVAATIEVVGGFAMTHDNAGAGMALLPLARASAALGLLQLVGLFVVPTWLLHNLLGQGITLRRDD